MYTFLPLPSSRSNSSVRVKGLIVTVLLPSLDIASTFMLPFAFDCTSMLFLVDCIVVLKDTTLVIHSMLVTCVTSLMSMFVLVPCLILCPLHSFYSKICGIYIYYVFALTYSFVRTWFCLSCHFCNYCCHYNNYLYVAYLIMDLAFIYIIAFYRNMIFFFTIYVTPNVVFLFALWLRIALYGFSPLQYAATGGFLIVNSHHSFFFW